MVPAVFRAITARHTVQLKRQLCTHPPASFFRGVFPIMATPFHSDETLDLDSFAKAVSFMRAAGANGVTIVGVLGESNRITDAERAALIRTAVDVAADAPDFRVCVGTSHAGTAATAALSVMAQELGADAVMVTHTKRFTVSSSGGR